MKKRRAALIAAAVALIALSVAWMVGRHLGTPKGAGVPTAFATAINLASAPADVQAAAAILKTSRVGYAMVKPDKTYLVISTGATADTVSIDRAEGQPNLSDPSLVDIFLKTDAKGDSLMIATTPLTKETEYQFDVDGRYADIPTLHNRHNLPLIPLDAKTGFSLVRPAPGFQAEAGILEVEGYARVFEAQFTAKLITEKGRVISQSAVMAAAGAPSWGSFSTRLKFDEQNAPETGYLVLEEEMTGAKLMVPVRFRKPAQMG
ncbi:MAG TPA: Gmad2 immunoglobulin-like domain-containing protein [Symbiobacteriaceae bacterium]|nr:Gmad2 immunoglobulin-like domain-containing protein [Symbiobacteriaceae bacterium]